MPFKALLAALLCFPAVCRAGDGDWAEANFAPVRAQASALRRSAESRRAADPNNYKPSGMFNTRAEATAMCRELSRRAAARGVTTLLVGFEGLMSFDSPGTAAAYRYQMAPGDRVRPLNVPIPMIPFVGGGYLLHGLIMPLIDRYGASFEFLLFRHLEQLDAEDHTPSLCAKEWLRGGPGRRVVVAGHSMGGTAAVMLAANLSAARLPVDLLVTIDTFPNAPPRPRAVRLWINYHQFLPLPAPSSYAPQADRNESFLLSNHFAIVYEPTIRATVGRALSGAPARP